jgi:hypothetical protein
MTAWAPTPKYVLKLLFIKNCQIANNSATTAAGEKNEHIFGVLGILFHKMYFIKLATDF